jgi:hypothetical protein
VLFIEILVAILAVSFVVFIFGSIIYKKAKGTYKGDCEICEKRMKKNLTSIKKELNKEFGSCCNSK